MRMFAAFLLVSAVLLPSTIAAQGGDIRDVAAHVTEGLPH